MNLFKTKELIQKHVELGNWQEAHILTGQLQNLTSCNFLFCPNCGEVLSERDRFFCCRLCNFNFFNRVYSGWAFTVDELLKQRVNKRIYERIKHSAKIKLVEQTSYYNKYEVLSKKKWLTNDEIALICDKGNLCFGYRKQNENTYLIHTN